MDAHQRKVTAIGLEGLRFSGIIDAAVESAEVIQANIGPVAGKSDFERHVTGSSNRRAMLDGRHRSVAEAASRATAHRHAAPAPRDVTKDLQGA